MTKKVYRTALGKPVDMGALMLKNEEVRAVGNMGVNARGDRVDSRGRSVESRNRQVTKQYQKQTNSNVVDEPVRTNAQERIVPVVQPGQPLPKAKEPKTSAPQFVDPVEKEVPSATSNVLTDVQTGGLADAIARARQIKQEPLKTPRQQAQTRPGVTKI